MDIRIQGDRVNGSTTNPSSRANEAVRVGGKGDRNHLIPGGGDGDSIGLSDLAAQISDANRTAEVHSSQRVSALEAVYSKGGEIADPTTVSRALIAHALGAQGDRA